MTLADIINLLALITTIVIFLVAHFISRHRDRVATNRETYQRLELAAIDLFRFEADHPELVRQLWSEGTALPKEGSAEERILVNFLCQYLNLFEMALRLRKEDIVPHEVFGSWVTWFLELAGAPAFSHLWKQLRCDYVPSLVEVMDKALAIINTMPDEAAQRKAFFEHMSVTMNQCPVIRNWHTDSPMEEASVAAASTLSNRVAAGQINDTIEVLWACSEDMAHQIAEFMAQNIDSNYISHGEIMDGRALDTETWHPDLVAILKRELLDSFPRQPDPARKDSFICCVRNATGDRIIAIAITGILRENTMHYAALHDMVIGRDSRSLGLGAQLLQRVEDTLRHQGIQRIFIESGLHNEGAHRFFKRAGFEQTSTVSCKVLA